MAERYKLPDGSERENGQRYDVIGVGITLIGFTIDGAVQWFPESMLTPVKPPTPPEPEPGPYMVGDWYAVHARTGRDKRWGIVGYPSIDWVDWEEFLDFVGPDVTITRLVPERVETVELPWHGSSTARREVAVDSRDSGAIRVEAGNDGVNLEPGVARAMAAALLLAASSAES